MRLSSVITKTIRAKSAHAHFGGSDGNCEDDRKIDASGMRLKELELQETVGQNEFYRKIVVKTKHSDPRRAKGVLQEVNIGLLLGQAGKLTESVTKPLYESLKDENKKLLALTHTNLTQIFNAFIEKDCVYYVIEYFDEGTLHRALAMRSGKMVPEPFPEPQVLDWFTQLSRGLQYLHMRDYVHGNINAKNVFFTQNLKVVKLGDCAVARVIERTGNLGKRTLGNLCYMAPEVWDAKPYTKKADIWSLGCLLYQLLSLKLPYEAGNNIELFFKVKAGTRAQVPFVYSPETTHLVDRMLAMDPGFRPIIEETVVDLEGAMTARPFQTVYWWNLKPPMRTSASFINGGNSTPASARKAKPWLSTPSKVVELLVYREGDAVLIICKDGEILAIANQFDGPEAVVRWRSKVHVPRIVANAETNLAHATMFPSRGLIFFTINPANEGIFMADLKELANSKASVELQRFDKGYATVQESDRLFNGLVADIENQALLCCDQSRKCSVGVWSVVDGRIHTEITLPGADETQFRPYKVALFITYLAGKRCQLLGICDTANSKIHLYRLSRANGVGLVDTEFVRTLASKGSIVGSLYQPQGIHFDPNGHLLVADAGNHRVQIFSAEMTNEAVKGVLWDSFTTNISGAFAEPVSVVSALDPKTSRPIILAGLHQDQEVLIFK